MLMLAVLFQFVLATVDIHASMRVSGRTLYASLRIVNLLFVLGQIRGVIKSLPAVRTSVLLGFEVDTVHVAVECMFDGK